MSLENMDKREFSRKGKAMHLVRLSHAPLKNEIVLSFTRASNKVPLLHDFLHLCLNDLLKKPKCRLSPQVHIRIYDPERLMNILPT